MERASYRNPRAEGHRHRRRDGVSVVIGEEKPHSRGARVLVPLATRTQHVSLCTQRSEYENIHKRKGVCVCVCGHDEERNMEHPRAQVAADRGGRARADEFPVGHSRDRRREMRESLTEHSGTEMVCTIGPTRTSLCTYVRTGSLARIALSRSRVLG